MSKKLAQAVQENNEFFRIMVEAGMVSHHYVMYQHIYLFIESRDRVEGRRKLIARNETILEAMRSFRVSRRTVERAMTWGRQTIKDKAA